MLILVTVTCLENNTIKVNLLILLNGNFITKKTVICYCFEKQILYLEGHAPQNISNKIILFDIRMRLKCTQKPPKGVVLTYMF